MGFGVIGVGFYGTSLPVAALMGLLVAASTITACTQQQEAPVSFRSSHSTNPFALIESDGRARGYYLALAAKCGADPKKIAAARLTSMPSRVDAESKAAYDRALSTNYGRAMREETIEDKEDSKCNDARVDRLTADLFPPPPDPTKMNRRQRERYYAEVEELKAQRMRREAAAAAEAQTRAAEANRQAQFERQSQEQERLIRLHSALELQRQLQQQNSQNQMMQQQNMNNLQQYYLNRSTPRPTINCNSFSGGFGFVNTTCQ